MPKSAAKTRAVVTVTRQKWQQSKQKYRQSLSSQKKVAIRKKDRERKQKKNPTMRAKVTSTVSGYSSKKSRFNSVSRVRARMPKDPAKFAAVIYSLTANCSPRKRKDLEDL